MNFVVTKIGSIRAREHWLHVLVHICGCGCQNIRTIINLDFVKLNETSYPAMLQSTCSLSAAAFLCVHCSLDKMICS